MHPKLPITVYRIALWPSPLCRSLCPGNTDSACASSGAPRYIDGTLSTKECVIARDIIKIDNVAAVLYCNKIPDKLSTNTEIRFTCIPGVKPVNTPNKIPTISASMISQNIT